MGSIENSLQEYLTNLREQNKILLNINCQLSIQLQLVQENNWDALDELLKETSSLVAKREDLAAAAERIKSDTADELGIKSLDGKLADKIPQEYLTPILTEINRMRSILERSNELTLENSNRLKVKIEEGRVIELNNSC